jgi:predicted TIM-barrel fold metal-dependent hydrolase
MENRLMSATASPEILISADSHVIEDSELWVKRLPAALRDQAPRYRPEELTGFTTHPGGSDPNERIKEMEIDGVSAEVLYPTLALRLFALTDPELQEACFRVYNDWLLEYSQVAPERLVGVACISTWDVGHAVAEMERTRKAGLRGALIWEVPHPDLPFRSEHYDPLWAAAQDLDMPINLHILTTGAVRTPLPGASPRMNRLFTNVNGRIAEISGALFDFVAGGVLHRFPGMKVVIVENEVGWIPFYLQQLDYYFSGKSGQPATDMPIDRNPSEYFDGQVYATLFNDPVGGHLLARFGQDSFMWSNDYPHGNSTWPNSRQVIARDLGHLPADVREKVLSQNVAKLYGLKVPAGV